MNRISIRLAGFVTVAALVLGTPTGATVDSARAAPGPVQDADTDLDRALQKVEALLGELRSKPDADRALLHRLEAIAADLRKARIAAKSNAGGPGAPGDGDTPGAGSPPDFLMELASWITERLYRDVDLRADQRSVSDDIARRFYTDYSLARKYNDEKSKQAILQDTKARFEAYLPRRQSSTIKSNLDTLVRRWEWMGRGGRGGR